MHQQRNEHSFFLVGPGHARAVFKPPRDARERRVWTKWLKAVAVTGACSSALALFVAAGHGSSPRDGTARMEQLATQLTRAQTIHPATAQVIDRLMRQPWYDCTQIACSAELEARNVAARARLRMLLAEKTRDDVVRTAGAQ